MCLKIRNCISFHFIFKGKKKTERNIPTLKIFILIFQDKLELTMCLKIYLILHLCYLQDFAKILLRQTCNSLLQKNQKLK